MQVNLIWPGRTRNPWLQGLESQYLEKINRMGSCSVLTTRESRGLGDKEKKRILAIEAEGIIKHLNGGHMVCLTDKGQSMTSLRFAAFMNDLFVGPHDRADFVVGGHHGLDASVLQMADTTLSLSRMTFSHELARVMLLEQIYRTISLNKGRKYAK